MKAGGYWWVVGLGALGVAAYWWFGVRQGGQTARNGVLPAGTHPQQGTLNALRQISGQVAT